MIKSAILALSSSVVVSIVVKVTLVAALGLIGGWLARRSRASVRHAWLAATFGALLALPITTILTPPVRMAVAVEVQRATVVPAAVGTIGTISPIEPRDIRTANSPPSSRGLILSLPGLLLAGWLGGVAVFLLPVAIGTWQL